MASIAQRLDQELVPYNSCDPVRMVEVNTFVGQNTLPTSPDLVVNRMP